MQKSTTESASWQKPLHGIKINQNQSEIPLKAGVLGRSGGRGSSHAAHYQAVTAAQGQSLGGVRRVGYVEVAGHELLFDLWGLNCLL